MLAIRPIIIIWHGLTKIFWFSNGTPIVLQENKGLVIKQINEIKKCDML